MLEVVLLLSCAQCAIKRDKRNEEVKQGSTWTHSLVPGISLPICLYRTISEHVGTPRSSMQAGAAARGAPVLAACHTPLPELNPPTNSTSQGAYSFTFEAKEEIERGREKAREGEKSTNRLVSSLASLGLLTFLCVCCLLFTQKGTRARHMYDWIGSRASMRRGYVTENKTKRGWGGWVGVRFPMHVRKKPVYES